MQPSSSDSGFFQEAPVLLNQFHDDAFRRAFKLFLPQSVAATKGPEIEAFGEEVISDQIFTWVTDSEKNKPYLKGNGRDPFGKFTGELVVGEGWRKLQEFGIKKGIVTAGYEAGYGPYARVVQFLRLHLWTPSSSMVPCPSAMHDGATRLLHLQLADPALDPERRRVFQNALTHLLSSDPVQAWTSGQWMTERTGGSDVSLTETLATPASDSQSGFASLAERVPLGPWSISGFKWFSSATDSNMTVLLAKTPGGGLSAFLAPMRRHAPHVRTQAGRELGDAGTELNGVRIQRLKNKLGTRSLPTAELELRGMRGWLLGEEGRGIAQIATVLNLTRIYSAVSAAGYLGRGLAVAKGFARVRTVGAGRGGRMPLAQSALHMRTLADLTVEYRALTHLSMLAAYVLGLEEHPRGGAQPPPALARVTPEAKHVGPLLRVVTQIAKAYACKNAITQLYACMESLGGVGFLENEEQEALNVAKLYRDCCVLAIWEGTTDVLSTDFVRAVKHPKGGAACVEALDALIRGSGVGAVEGGEKLGGWRPLRAWEGVKARLARETQAQLMGGARALLWVVAEVLVTVLLFVDAESDGSDVAADVLRRFVAIKKLGSEDAADSAGRSEGDRLRRDQLIVYGEEDEAPVARL